jgi:glutamine amidotransferase
VTVCELFCLASRLPTVATLSLRRFAARGGLEQRLIDGWGLALYDGADLRLYREPSPARGDPWLAFIESRRVATPLLISHIRHATRGAITLANTQPFVREIGGRMHCFAHNGMLPLIEKLHPIELERYRPVGDTDSEYAACLLFERVARLWTALTPPSLADRFAVVAAFAKQMREIGPANFLYCDGITLFAHGHRRMQPDGRLAPPGLWRLRRACERDDDAMTRAGVHLEAGTEPQELTLLASVPLTTEPWLPFEEGELIAIENGIGA